MEKFKNSDSYRKIYNVLQQYFGENFLDTLPDQVSEQTTNNTTQVTTPGNNYQINIIMKHKLGADVKIATFIMDIFRGLTNN